jgi:urease accessory protein
MLKRLQKYGLLGLVMLGLPTTIFAHPGHGLENAYSAFMHPLTGWDHLLMMIAIGISAAKAGGNLRWQLPVTFMIVMALSMMLSSSGFYFAGVESAVAASVLAMGFILISSFKMSGRARLVMTAVFAVFHGMAHGVELNVQYQAIAAVLMATALLHGLGYYIGSMRFKLSVWMQNVFAVIMMVLGGYALY